MFSFKKLLKGGTSAKKENTDNNLPTANGRQWLPPNFSGPSPLVLPSPPGSSPVGSGNINQSLLGPPTPFGRERGTLTSDELGGELVKGQGYRLPSPAEALARSGSEGSELNVGSPADSKMTSPTRPNLPTSGSLPTSPLRKYDMTESHLPRRRAASMSSGGSSPSGPVPLAGQVGPRDATDPPPLTGLAAPMDRPNLPPHRHSTPSTPSSPLSRFAITTQAPQATPARAQEGRPKQEHERRVEDGLVGGSAVDSFSSVGSGGSISSTDQDFLPRLIGGASLAQAAAGAGVPDTSHPAVPPGAFKLLPHSVVKSPGREQSTDFGVSPRVGKGDASASYRLAQPSLNVPNALSLLRPDSKSMHTSSRPPSTPSPTSTDSPRRLPEPATSSPPPRAPSSGGANRPRPWPSDAHPLPLPLPLPSALPKSGELSGADSLPSVRSTSSKEAAESSGREGTWEAKTLMPTKWKKGENLGSGSFGSVYLGLNSENGELFAVKEVPVSLKAGQHEKESIAQLEQEVALLSRLKHPNIVQYVGTAREVEKLFIFLEYVPGGSISSLLGRFGHFDESLIRVYTRQILLGLKYLHDTRTVHRDIKGANILVEKSGRVKLADFGMAKQICEDMSVTKSFKGSAFWMAPEVIKQRGHGLPADIWSVGCTVLEMADGRPPWSGECNNQLAAMYKIASTEDLPAFPEHLSTEARDFIVKCLRRNPDTRPTAAELLQHPFVANAPTGVQEATGPAVAAVTAVLENTRNPGSPQAPFSGVPPRSTHPKYSRLSPTHSAPPPLDAITHTGRGESSGASPSDMSTPRGPIPLSEATFRGPVPLRTLTGDAVELGARQADPLAEVSKEKALRVLGEPGGAAGELWVRRKAANVTRAGRPVAGPPQIGPPQSEGASEKHERMNGLRHVGDGGHPCLASNWVQAKNRVSFKEWGGDESDDEGARFGGVATIMPVIGQIERGEVAKVQDPSQELSSLELRPT